MARSQKATRSTSTDTGTDSTSDVVSGADPTALPSTSDSASPSAPGATKAAAASSGRAAASSKGAAKQAPASPPTEAETPPKTAPAAATAAPDTSSRAPAGPGGGSGRSTPREPREGRKEFEDEQRKLLIAERATYTTQAEELKAQADSLALEHEPGDVQFDEEGGEGGTSNVDRELDLILSAQARASITEIDLALAKIDAGTYGVCEQCGAEIPEARLQALPHASLCVTCKSGGLSSRR